MTKASKQPLITELAVRQHYLRAAHIEHHEGQTAAGYIPTARGLEVIHRIARAMSNDDAGRAWSLTGPYGAGKSSFGLFLHALLGPQADPAYVEATNNLLSAESTLAQLLADGRRKLGAGQQGFIRAATTAQREPITDTVLRALHTSAWSRWRARMPAAVREALAAASADRTPRAVSLALQTLTEQAPVLLIIDEFGKNLEYFAEKAAAADLFVLQELAERCSGPQGLPAFIVTLQHLAFDDYVRTADVVQRREWGKIQGRFEDIPFVDGAEQAARLVSAAFISSTPSTGFVKARKIWAAEQTRQCDDLGLLPMIPGSGQTIIDCYPLHPLTLLTLPDMCARFGQHGRTLFSFLNGREPHSVVEFLENTFAVPQLASVSLDQLYDFFINSAGGANAQHDARLTEVNVTIREASGLTADEARVLKIVGVLNLLSQGGPLRASRHVIAFALSARGTPTDPEEILRALEQRGLLTYRAFADEYRLWRGSDLDLRMIVSLAREEISHASPAALLAREHKMPPAIAGRHSQRVGMLRYFETAFADSGTRSVSRLDIDDEADGLVVYYLGPPESAAELTISGGTKPVVLATTAHHDVLVEAVLELVAVQHALKRDDVRVDHVARRELQDRVADARRRLTNRIAMYLRPDAPGVQFRLVTATDVDTALPAARGLSPLLSAICDRIYSASPEIRNEMLGRRELTSQAAKARRELLEAMVTHQDEEWLGFTGFGPEKAMYAALLRHTEMHADLGDGFGFEPPHGRHTGMAYAWRTAERVITAATDEPVGLDKVYAALLSPPIGLKEGPVPVILTALLLAHSEDIAIYQEGTYQPAITPELLERLVKSPGRFSAKHFATGDTQAHVIAAVADAIESATGRRPTGVSGRRGARRNLALLAVAGPLLTFARSLPEYTLRTHRLSSDAEATRDALLNTREPETLLFDSLPRACGLTPFTGSGHGRTDDIDLLRERLAAALEELRGCYRELLEELSESLSVELRLSDDLAILRVELRGQVVPLTDTLLEPWLRSFVLLANQIELDDEAWLEAVANNLTTRPAAAWRDEDVARFDIELRATAASYRRVLALHYEALAATQAGFDAHRVTMTNPDGSEHSSVVWVDHSMRPHIELIVAQARASATALLGARGAEALLALLAENVLGQRQNVEASAPTAPETEETNYV